MTKLKLLFLTLLSVISLNLFSQTQVYVTNTTSPNVCDGMAVLMDTVNINMTSIYWQSMGAIISQGDYYVQNLCPGTYNVTFILNGVTLTETFTIQAGTFNPCQNFTGIITTTNSIDSTTCDGDMTPTILGGTAPYTYQWSNGVTTQSTGSLCPGVYCCYIVDANGCTLQLCDTVGVFSTSYGDTLVINNPGNCLNPIGTISSIIEDCSLDYNAVDTAYISSISNASSPLDTMVVWWYLVDTLGSIDYMATYHMGILNTGCYNFQLTLYCLQKSMNYKTIIVNETRQIDVVGIDELSMSERKLIKVIDLMGRTTELTPNQILINCYNDGTTEKIYITE